MTGEAMIKNSLLTKGFALTVIVLFIAMSIPSTGKLMFNDDTTPPVTTCTLDPPEPNGENGWYVSDVEVTLDATDDMSGVKEIKYKIGTGIWYTISGSHGIFVIDVDGDDLLIKYYAIDNAGNEESINSFQIDMDQTPPDIEEVEYEPYKENCTWYLKFYCNATDTTSGMDRVEMYVSDELYETINGSGPNYEFLIVWSKDLACCTLKFIHYDVAGNLAIDDIPYIEPPPPPPFIIGLICNPKVTDQNVTFFAVIVMYKHYDEVSPIPERDIFILKRLSFPDTYQGYIGRFFICATFEKGPLETTLSCEIE